MAAQVIAPMASELHAHKLPPFHLSERPGTGSAGTMSSQTPRQRPLPALPKPASLHAQLSAQLRIQSPPPMSKAAGKRRARPLSLATTRRALSKLLEEPRILSHLLGVLPWGDFHSLMSTCREFRRELFHRPECRDAILSHYVPGYRMAQLAGDQRHCREVAVDMHDLALLLISQYAPLHRFPMHSMRLLKADAYLPDFDRIEDATARLVALTQAHSRFVLMLQSLVYSAAPSPTFDESDDVLGYLSSFRAPQYAGVKELEFPAPLFFFGSEQRQGVPVVEDTASTASHRRTGSACSGASSSPPRLSRTSTRASSDLQALVQRPQRPRSRFRSMSIFGGSKVPPPPPSSDPMALRCYSNSWRRSLRPPPRARLSVISASASDDEGSLKMPPRRFGSVAYSSESSLSSPSPSSRSNVDNTDSSNSRERARELPPAPAPIAVPRGASPHDLWLATSRTRAPVLRAFVPCTALDEDALAACEEQLADAGLWEHLSVGDVVCNFGYVPPPEETRAGAGATQKWLLFNGYNLVPYTPPAPPPLASPLALPSPFYYAHILPPFSDPVYVLSLPPLGGPRGHAHARDAQMQLSLAHLHTRVRSPHAPSGFALARKYMWLARLLVPNVDAYHSAEDLKTIEGSI
ncbi:hypothetical protein OBBRIDRAFT_573224 [Obba rivulosa]|uniref:F-box domain-containing protein n=1 Tax=Obba rivulosa TaxID=1052685 RepID=A0A8E2J7N7_9APHY|nr:hypothetical protein OBBRIDRAFT_573224 [Obba rivulosa]